MKKLLPLGYLGSIILFLSSIIYFFAGNWATFTRFEKLALSISAMLFFYLLSVLATRFITHHEFLGKWLVVAGAITFGVSVALVGQIYNSHADSFMLFLVWLIPTLLLALITHYLPFWMLSYILFHLTYWFYLNPSSYHIVRSDFQEWLSYFILALINMIIFGLTFTRTFSDKYIRYLSYIATHAFLIGVSFVQLFEPFSGWTNLIYIGFVVFSYHYFSANKTDRGLTIILFVMGSIYVYVKLIELPFLFELEFLAIQLSGIIISISLIVGGIFLAKKITDKNKSNPVNQVLKRILIVIVTLFGSSMFVVSFGGILFMITENEYATVFVSLLFITSGLTLTKLDPAARHTLLFIGFFSGLLEAIFLSIPITILFIIISVIVTFLIKDGVVRFISYTTALGCSLSLVLQEMNVGDNYDLVFLFFLAVNIILWYLCRSVTNLRKISYFYSLLFLFALTFLNKGLVLEVIYSLLFFVTTTLLIIFFTRNEDKYANRLTSIFWFAFLVFTYYDFVWSLVHKSISLLIIGIIILMITRIVDRHSTQSVEESRLMPFGKRWISIGIIVILQLGILGYQVSSNEILLRDGTEITLQLAPIDPRSMLQGDYVRLAYEIGEAENLDVQSGNRVYVILEKNEQGIYERKQLVTEQIDPSDYPLNENEVLITGKYNGYNAIIFGIESYFVEEGTGLAVERNATLAKVAVSKKGDALLLSVQ
ncbi:GDYXXLXY domain-containing protein [Bacillus sp. PS06]|uniref:GDYXXLXY domain-containing protein n=1 Tax=Bacillus sp. PS06 TaxID=2764176 RepID=UPI001784CD32|nr:GDYXXLXY domain-containing protein [Bacillus sp. PS06]MBD8067711.1 GDYXXLXY domain-containing protein [Bacillus sp. PS06]